MSSVISDKNEAVVEVEQKKPPKKKVIRAQKESEAYNRGMSPDAVSIVIKGHPPIIPQKAGHINLMIALKEEKDITLVSGPAGVGKTYMVTAQGCEDYENGLVKRIILARAFVEDPEEKMGFLPGDIKEKSDPYIRPMYDALNKFWGATKVAKMIENGEIEVVPFAHMRGRNFDNSFVFLDEAQNVKRKQMKTFLTRMAVGSRYVICMDPTQIDLVPASGTCVSYLKNLLNMGVQYLEDNIVEVNMNKSDIIRHPIVEAIVEADALLEEQEAFDK